MAGQNLVNGYDSYCNVQAANSLIFDFIKIFLDTASGVGKSGHRLKEFQRVENPVFLSEKLLLDIESHLEYSIDYFNAVIFFYQG